MSGGGAQSDASEVFARLSAHYLEPHRRYHTPAHIEHCLRMFDLASHLMTDPDAIEMALWFHDAIYDARGCSNEKLSAELFAECAAGRGPEPFRQKVDDLIMVTVHQQHPESCDECFMVDIDLSSFGLPWEEMKRDSVAVREEFPHLSDETFYTKQKRFLESLLAREPFCFTEFFRERHEDAARDNIRRHLEKIEALGFD